MSHRDGRRLRGLWRIGRAVPYRRAGHYRGDVPQENTVSIHIQETPVRDGPSELEMHRADYQAIREAGFESPGELLAAYKRLAANANPSSAAPEDAGATDVWFAEGKVILDQNRLTVGTAVTAEDAALMAAAPELLALAEQYASECSECNGTGMRLIEQPSFDGEREDCPECAEIREVIAKAKVRQ